MTIKELKDRCDRDTDTGGNMFQPVWAGKPPTPEEIGILFSAWEEAKKVIHTAHMFDMNKKIHDDLGKWIDKYGT